MKILFSFEVGAFVNDINGSEYEIEDFELSESWLKMEKAFKDILLLFFINLNGSYK